VVAPIEIDGMLLLDGGLTENLPVRVARALGAVRQLLDEPGAPAVYLYGGEGVGKSHLLQAACRACGRTGRPGFYLPLAPLEHWHPGMLEGLETMRLVALDDVHAIAGDDRCERVPDLMHDGHGVPDDVPRDAVYGQRDSDHRDSQNLLLRHRGE
jgi:hypothetical protein